MPARASTSSSWRFWLTTIRVSEEQTWPARKHSARARVVAAAARSMSSRMTAADLPPSSRVQRAIRSPQMRGDPPAGGGRAGEGDLVDARVADQQLGHLPVGRDDVEHARRQADRLGDLGHHVGLARRLGRGLEDDGATGQQGGGDLVADEAEGGVPGDDGADDADGLAHEEPELATLLRLAPPPRRGTCRPARRSSRRSADAPATDALATAWSTPDSRGQIWPRSSVRFSSSVAMARRYSARSRVAQARPRSVVEGLARRGDGPRHVGFLRLGDAEEELLGGGVDHVDHGVRRGLHPLAADEEPIRVAQGCADVVGDGHGVSNREVGQFGTAALGGPNVQRDSP